MLLLPIEKCEELTTIPNKITGIIATSNAPLECLAWSVFSLLLRSKRDLIEHFIVVINGPDRRTGDPTLQDQKQRFLEGLRNLQWQNKDMPITISRTWSRVGHAQALEQAITWVHTQNYLLMHDDAILLNSKWQDEAKNFLQNEKCATKTWQNYKYGSFADNSHPEGNSQLGSPHFNSVFALCKKPIFYKLGIRWPGYHIPITFHIDDFVNYEEIIAWHEKHKSLNEKYKPSKDKEYKLVSMDIGAIAYDRLTSAGYEFDQFSDDIIFHFNAASWGNKAVLTKALPAVLELEKEISKNKDYLELYRKYVNYEFSNINR